MKTVCLLCVCCVFLSGCSTVYSLPNCYNAQYREFYPNDCVGEQKAATFGGLPWPAWFVLPLFILAEVAGAAGGQSYQPPVSSGGLPDSHIKKYNAYGHGMHMDQYGNMVQTQ